VWYRWLSGLHIYSKGMKSHALVKIRNHLHGFPIRRRHFKRPRMMYARACTRDFWTVTLGQQIWVQRALQVLRPSSRSTGTTSSSRSYTRRSPCWSTSISTNSGMLETIAILVAASRHVTIVRCKCNSIQRISGLVHVMEMPGLNGAHRWRLARGLTLTCDIPWLSCVGC